MKNVLKSLALGLGLAVFATAAAYAAPLNGSISLNLTGTYTNGQSATFTSATVGLSSGSFAVFNAGATVGGPNPLVFSQVTPGETLVTITEGANTLTLPRERTSPAAVRSRLSSPTTVSSPSTEVLPRLAPSC